MSRARGTAYVHETEQVAQRLGLPAYGPGTDEAIVGYCRDEVMRLVGKQGLPRTMDELLEQVATCLEVEFFEIHTDDDLERLRSKFPPTEEPAIVSVLLELDDGVDAITIRRMSPEAWDHPYLAVINCRGMHSHRRYFSKWHELAHRLIDGEQLMLAFRTTPVERPDPGEVLVDKVAAELAFFPDIVAPYAARAVREHGVTLDAVDALRNAVVPDASRQAAALALLNYVERPAWYLRCEMSLKPTEMRLAGGPDARASEFEPKLRVMEASSNQAARESRARIHPWMRVPESGIMARALTSARDLTGTEPVGMWNISANGSIRDGHFLVDCIVIGEHVVALVSIAEA